MIRFLRFSKTDVEDSEFKIISGKESVKFFLKRVLYLILSIYSTLFLAVAIPFVKTPFIPIYFIGGIVTSIFIIRFINHIRKYVEYENGNIHIFETGVEVKCKEKIIKINADDITYFEENFLGNFIIREKNSITSFPLMLLQEEDREKLISLFEDIAPKRTAIYKKIREFVDAIAVALILAVHIIQYIVQAYYIPTGSMEDTLKIGDHLFVEKITYGPIIPKMIGMEKHIHLHWLGIRSVQRGDIVIFRPPHEVDKDYIKRCIAVPGDKFGIKNGRVYINNKMIKEPYTKGITSYFNFGVSKNKEIQGIVPAGKVVVLGDNRENSQDGRYFGYLDIEKIKGRAFILYWNTKQIYNCDISRLGLIR